MLTRTLTILNRRPLGSVKLRHRGLVSLNVRAKERELHLNRAKEAIERWMRQRPA